MISTEKNHSQTIILTGATTIFLLADLTQFFMVGKIAVPLLLCLYSAMLFSSAIPIILVFIAFLQCIEFFCFYNSFFLAFFYLIPLTGCALFIRKNIYPSFLHAPLLALTGALIQMYAIESYLLGITTPHYYTITRISGILFLTACFSLTIKSGDMLDNRA